MKVNVVEYRASEDDNGNSYTARLWFILEPDPPSGENAQDHLKKSALRGMYAKADTDQLWSVTGAGRVIAIPTWSTYFTGFICGEEYDDPDEDVVLSGVTFGDIEYSETARTCYREVELEWSTPSSSSGAGGKGKEDDNPSNWSPDWRQSTQQIQRDGRLIFYGFLNKKDFNSIVRWKDGSGVVTVAKDLDPDRVYHLGKSELTDAGRDDTTRSGKQYQKGDNMLPVNSAGQIFDPPLQTVGIVQAHQFTEYLTGFRGTGVMDETVNNRNLRIKVASYGVSSGQWNVILDWPRGTAKFADQTIESALHTYKNASGITFTVPYFIRTTTVLVSSYGWTYEMLNAGYMYVDSDGKAHNARVEDGIARVPIGLDWEGDQIQSADVDERLGAMVYGPPESSFAYFGNTVGNTIEVR